MNFRTDLALERRELFGEKSIPGVKTESFSEGDIKVTRIEIENREGALALGKPEGKYVTVEAPPFARNALIVDDCLSVLTREIRSVLPAEGGAFIAGLGNMKITPDAFGPKCASMIFATRHIKGELLKATGLSGLREVSVLATGVTGETGAEAEEVIRGITDALKPDFVVTIDALAARSVSRLGATVQMCDTGIIPGSGVGNSRREISEKTIGVPVVSIGVPTVVDASTLVADSMDGECDEEAVSRRAGGMMVTPREVDLMIERASKLTSLALNCALQPNISPEDMLVLTA